MKTFVKLLVIALTALAGLSVEATETDGAQFPGNGTALRSPSAKYEVYCVDAESSADAKRLGDNHALFLKSVGTGADTKVITFGRHVAVTWAPTSEVFFVNDHYGSGQVRCRVFACGSGEPRELFHRFSAVDCEAVAWVNSSALKVVVRDSAGEREELSPIEPSNARPEPPKK